MNIRIFKINKIKMFWFIILFMLGLGYLYFYKYNQPTKEEFGVINSFTNQNKRELNKMVETIKNKKDSFINQTENAVIKQFL